MVSKRFNIAQFTPGVRPAPQWVLSAGQPQPQQQQPIAPPPPPPPQPDNTYSGFVRLDQMPKPAAEQNFVVNDFAGDDDVPFVRAKPKPRAKRAAAAAAADADGVFVPKVKRERKPRKVKGADPPPPSLDGIDLATVDAKWVHQGRGGGGRRGRRGGRGKNVFVVNGATYSGSAGYRLSERVKAAKEAAAASANNSRNNSQQPQPQPQPQLQLQPRARPPAVAAVAAKQTAKAPLPKVAGKRRQRDAEDLDRLLEGPGYSLGSSDSFSTSSSSSGSIGLFVASDDSDDGFSPSSSSAVTSFTPSSFSSAVTSSPSPRANMTTKISPYFGASLKQQPSRPAAAAATTTGFGVIGGGVGGGGPTSAVTLPKLRVPVRQRFNLGQIAPSALAERNTTAVDENCLFIDENDDACE